ncbi:GNAT family N-acetyltransferase [Kineosporia sp. NBRC 101731]|uniref:GNAT family N-acetyltransferase n=1 Tax=Kineosporia sp. NBRC 101731 TaxID=3032199 RepID=UPI0025539D3B|nr:GNAT family N-acetyltransferase [Kineosporia sp. NBRC 101731]
MDDVASLGFRTDLVLRRLGGSLVSDRGSHLVVRTPENPGYWWGNFLLLREQPGVGEWPGWVAEFEREFPGADHIALGLDGVDGAVPDPEGAAALGLEVMVDAVLTATELTPPAPADLLIRPLESSDDWHSMALLRLSLEESSADDHAEFVHRKAAEYRQMTQAGHGVWFGAFVDGEMRCGAGLFTDGSGVARFQNVETHPAYRRRGLASTLVHRLGEWGLSSMGAEKLVIVADPGYHAIGMYRALGFEDAEHKIQAQRPPSG